MYQFSNFSGKIKNASTNEIFPEGEDSQRYLDFLEWRSQSGNTIDFLDYFNPEETYDYNFDQSRRQEVTNYDQRRSDGLEYSKNNRAWLKTKLDFEEISEPEYLSATDALIEVRDQIESGDWVKAKQFLETNEQLINSSVYETMHAFISAYVTASYESSLMGGSALEQASQIVGNRPNDR